MQNTVICRDGICNEIESILAASVLAAWDRGLGSVINGQGITRSDIVRSEHQPNGDFVRYVGFAE